MLEVIDAKTSGTRLQQDKESGLYQAKFVIPQYCHLVGKPTGLSVDKKFNRARRGATVHVRGAVGAGFIPRSTLPLAVAFSYM